MLPDATIWSTNRRSCFAPARRRRRRLGRFCRLYKIFSAIFCMFIIACKRLWAISACCLLCNTLNTYMPLTYTRMHAITLRVVREG